MKIGTIGTNFIVDAFLDSLTSIPEVECTAIYSRRNETALPLVQKYGVGRIYTDLGKMFTDPQVDFVYVASPNSLHFEQTYQALASGKNVICEKPFTSTLNELNQLISLAKDRHLMLFEAITTIHLPNFKLLRENLSKLGKIKIVQCNYSQYSSRYNKLLAGETPNVFNPEFSGGALVDLNIYNLHFVMSLWGSPEDVHYYANKHENGIDTSGILVLEYPDFLVQCVGSKDSNSLNFGLIQGEKGYVHIENGVNGCRKLIFYLSTETITIDQQTHQNLLYYEVKKFSEIYSQKDYATCYTLLDHSSSVLAVLERARKEAGIIFPVDEDHSELLS